ncbi:protein-L-isoaspartate O-methyltransferase [Methylophaga sp. 41_12_T18]|nr:protein-L-isoaspartate O-methyltransferase [Methylophaga sp. 41_12_T18]
MTVNLQQAHSNMIEQQVRPSDVLNPQVLAALNSVKREAFVDGALAGLAYADTQLPIGFGQVMLSPVQEGRLLQALNIQSDETVLELGTGSGYFTALLATLAEHVFSVEIIPELSAAAQQALTNAAISNVTLSLGDTSQAVDVTERFDVIVATAAFVTIPDDYLQALQIGGRMLAVVGEEPVMSVQIIHRVSEREWQTKTVSETVIPAMINAEPKAEFKF